MSVIKYCKLTLTSHTHQCMHWGLPHNPTVCCIGLITRKNGLFTIVEMMRCDCNGCWKNIGCSHVYALAYWCVGAAIGLKLSCNCVASASRYDMGLLDLYKCCKVMAPNAKPGRKRKKKQSLEIQPDSPLRQQQRAQQVKQMCCQWLRV